MTISRTGCEVVTLPGGSRAIKDCASGQVMHCGTGPSVEPGAIYVTPSRLALRLREVRAEGKRPHEKVRAEGKRPHEKAGSSLVLFDVGMGAASNALAAWQVSEAAPAGARRLELVSFDHEVLALELALLPENQASFGLSEPAARTAVQALLTYGKHETERTSWRLVLGDFPTMLALEPAAAADIVFWDLYSARANPQLWTVALFQLLRGACRDGATLHTTSIATSARTSMLLGGFAVGTSVGTGTRAETTIASTDHHALHSPLGARWIERLGRSSVPFSSDVVNGDVALATVRSLSQFLEGAP